MSYKYQKVREKKKSKKNKENLDINLHIQWTQIMLRFARSFEVIVSKMALYLTKHIKSRPEPEVMKPVLGLLYVICCYNKFVAHNPHDGCFCKPSSYGLVTAYCFHSLRERNVI